MTPPRYCPSPATCAFGDDEPFMCAGCGRLVCWCFGLADRAPDLCDACAVRELEPRDTLRAPAGDVERSAAE